MENILEVKNITKVFHSHAVLHGKLTTYALDNVSVSIEKEKITGVVGQSGSGKSTLARVITSLVKQTSGSVFFKNKNIEEYLKLNIKAFRKELQMVFQDPSSTLNPRLTIKDTLSDPLSMHGNMSKKEKHERMTELLRAVELDESALSRYPHEFSGGQRQRIGIARAIATNPSFLILDEPVSALDISVQGQILNLLLKLKEDYSLTYMFITHDLALVRYMCDDVVVIYSGRVMETGSKKDIFENPLHPYTKLLLDSAFKTEIPKQNVDAAREEKDKCVFYAYCENRSNKCVRNISMLDFGNNHSVACINT